MDFIQAVKAMKEGKKVRRGEWDEGAYWYRNVNNPNGQITKSDGGQANFTVANTLETDWQIVGEKKTLSDGIMYAFMHSKQNELLIMGNPTEENIDKFVERGFIPVDNIKEAIKDIKKDIDKLKMKFAVGNEPLITKQEVKDIINKRIGERLI